MANQITYQKLCASCQEKTCTPFHHNFRKAQELGREIVQKKYTSYMIDNYKNIQFRQTTDYTMRTDKFCYRLCIASLHFKRIRLARYKGFPCKTVYGGGELL